MSRTPRSRLAARGVLALLAGLSAVYALLAYLPFTYEAVIRFPMVSWIPGFVALQPWLWLAAWTWNLLADRPLLRQSRPLRWAHLALAAGSAALLVHPPLRAIRNDASSLALAWAFLLAPLALLGADGVRRLRRGWTPGAAGEPRRLFLAAFGGALTPAVLFPVLAWRRSGPLPAGLPGWGWLASGALLAGLAVAAALMGLISLGRLARRTWAEPALLLLALALAGAAGLQGLAFRAIAFQGPLAFPTAFLVASLVLVLLAATALALPAAGEECALDLLLRPLGLLLRGRAWRGAAWLAAVALGGALLQAKAAVFDWNFLFQKSGVALVGLLAGAGTYAATRPLRPRIFWVWALLLTPVVTLNVFLAADAGMARPAALGQAGSLLDATASRDVSVALLRQLLNPAREAARPIFRILQRNSNIPRDVRTDPVEIQHAPLTPAGGPRPDIYIFVVDSLRRDYLGTYNPGVTFTPNLDRFAAESRVFRNAFTRYGATGLSEPSIWTGGAMLHKQYITPFHPMNSLQKLVEAEGYEGLVSMDSILDVVVKRGPWLRDLDPGVGTQDLRLGASLGKLEAALRAQGPQRKPLFVYSQAQDIHVSVINREGGGVVAPGDYRGFYAPYASRLRRLDASFGQFVAYLKAAGRYDSSLIIFTADHGDSLGEEGRFGHAYTLYPEIVRIPLLVHLPAGMADAAWAPEDPAFLVDLTPSFYYLLGHRDLRADPNLGRPLFTRSLDEQARFRRDHYLLASSYGAVFGILDDRGRTLYIADGVNFRDHLYRLDPDGGSAPRAAGASLKAKYDRMIQDDIDQVNRFYHFQPR